MVIRLIGSLDMNDVKQEDAMRYDDQKYGKIQGVALIVDGATGFQKDIDEKGNIVPLPDVTQNEFSSARIWADILADELAMTAKDENLGVLEVLQSSIESATSKMPIVNKNFENFQTPSSSVMMSRVRGGLFEVVGSGDCCLVVEYKDGNVDVITGNEILDKIRADRTEKIKRENPGFDEISKEEKAKIQFKYMKATRQNLGDRKEGYFVPFYDGTDKMNAFLGEMRVVSQNQSRGINNVERGDIWVMLAKVEDVKSFLMSSDGFIDKVLKNKMANAEEIMANAKADKNYIKNLGKALRIVEKSSDGDFNAVAMKLAQGKKNTGSADDAVAMFFEVNKSSNEAIKEREQTFGLALAKHYKGKE